MNQRVSEHTPSFLPGFRGVANDSIDQWIAEHPGP